MNSAWLGLFALLAASAFAQTSAESFPPVPTMQQLMLDLIHPASNDILLFVNRGSPKDEKPKDEKEWAAIRRSALTLAEAGTLLMLPNRARDKANWTTDAKNLADVGTEAYKAAQAKDFPALAAITDSLDASCTTCHKQYRPNVFPHNGDGEGASK
jgi:cytochrome c556